MRNKKDTKLKPLILPIATIVSLLSSLTPSGAYVINLDIQDGTTNIYSGLGAAPDVPSNTFWNQVGLGGSTNILFSDNTNSGVTISTATFNNAFSNVNESVNALLGDRIIHFGDTGEATIEISNLLPEESYNLYAYSGYYSQEFSVGAISATATGEGFTENNPSNWVEGVQYGLLENVISDENGSIVLTVQNTSPNPNGFDPTTVISGLQIERIFDPEQPIPEPLTILGTSFVAACLPILKKQKKSKPREN